MSEAFAAAYSTLSRAAAFLSDGLGIPEGGTLGRGTARVIGNSLRELDRFLNLLIDEAAIGHGLAVAPRQHNTANKLARLRAALDQPDDDHHQLRAMGRTREWLFHCGGAVPHGEPMPGWAPATGALGSPGETMRITRATLADIGSFYTNVAASLPAGGGPDQPTISSGLKK